jgi:hypothetical protein
MEGEAVHGQATRSVGAHDHPFASVCLDEIMFSPFANISAVTTKQRGLFRTVLLVSKFQDRNFLLRAETEETGNN